MQAHGRQNNAEYEVVKDYSHEDPLDLLVIVRAKAQILVLIGSNNPCLI